jgi:hypothetical protein
MLCTYGANKIDKFLLTLLQSVFVGPTRRTEVPRSIKKYKKYRSMPFPLVLYRWFLFILYLPSIVSRVYLPKIRYFNTASSESCAFLSLSDGFSYIFVEKFLPSPLVMVTTTILEFFLLKTISLKTSKVVQAQNSIFFWFFR